MANPDKQKCSEPTPNSQSQLEDLKRAEKDVERRLVALEESVKGIQKSHLEAHKWFTTIFLTVVFSLVGLLITYMGNQSRNDVRASITDVRASMQDMKSDMRNATADMRGQVDKATGEMAKNFQTLAGESLKKPVIELYCEGVPLESRIIDISCPQNYDPSPVLIGTLFVKNIGDKRTEPLSIRISFAGAISLDMNERQEWQEASSFEKDFPATFYSTRHDTVAPQETLNIHPLILQGQSFPNWNHSQTNVLCKMQVFFGGEKPAESQFRIRLLQK